MLSSVQLQVFICRYLYTGHHIAPYSLKIRRFQLYVFYTTVFLDVSDMNRIDAQLFWLGRSGSKLGKKAKSSY